VSALLVFPQLCPTTQLGKGQAQGPAPTIVKEIGLLANVIVLKISIFMLFYMHEKKGIINNNFTVRGLASG
jgi:hypothetical protein